MADITFGHRTGHTPPATMNHPGQWHYVATRLMAHMGAYSPDEMNGLHWQWHQRAALRIRATVQEHNIWDIPGPSCYQGYTSGHQRPRPQDVPEPPRQTARRNSPERPRGPPPGMGSPCGTYRSPLRRFAPRRGPGSHHTSGMQGARRNSARRQGTLAAPAAATARHLPRHGESCSMRVWTETMGAPTTPTPNGHHLPPIPDADPRDPALTGRTSPPFSRQPSASDRQRFTRAPNGRQTQRPAHPLPPSHGRRPTRCRGDHTPRTRGEGSPRPTQGLRKGWGDSSPHNPPTRARGDDTGPGHGNRPPDRPDPCSTGFSTPAATRPNRQGAEGASQQREHDASGPGADAEMTETSDPEGSDDPLPAATTCWMPQQREPSKGYAPGGHPRTTSRHPSPTSATLDQDQVTMPPPARQPPQQRSTGLFDDAELRALYGNHATTPSGELVAALWEHLQDVKPNRLFAVVPLPHAATTEIFVRQLRALVTPGTQISDDLVEEWIWWFNTHQPAQGGVWVPQLGWVHTLIAPPTDPRPAPSTGGRERAAPPPRPETLCIPPYEGLAAWESGTARDRGRNLRSLAAGYPETARAAPPLRERDPTTIAMIVLENGHYYQVPDHPAPTGEPLELGGRRLHAPAHHSSTGQLHAPAQRPAPGPPDGHPVGDGRHLEPRSCPLLPLAVGAAPLPAHQGMVSDMEVLPRWPAAAGGHPPARTDGRDPHCAQPVPRLRDPPDRGAGAGQGTAAHHPH